MSPPCRKNSVGCRLAQGARCVDTCNMHLLKHTSMSATALYAFAACTLYAAASSAQTPRFHENWDNGTMGWRTTSYAIVPTNVDTATTQGAALTVLSEPTTCAGSFARETPANKGSGGRVFQVPAAAAQQTVAAGDTMCIAAWLRNGAAGGQAYLGINYVQSAVGYTDTRYGAAGPGAGVFRDSTYREHWLIGTDDIGAAGDRPWGTGDPEQAAYGSTEVMNATPGAWRLYTKAWTVTKTDLRSFNGDPGANAFVLKFENFGGDSNNSKTPGDNADFGDIFVFNGACPSTDAIAALSSVHEPCAAGSAAAFCVSSGAAPNQISTCAGCDASFGTTGTKVCAAASPICITTGANAGQCRGCDADQGSSKGTTLCNSALAPYCSTKPGASNLGSCGKCTLDADCIEDSGGPNHAGIKCDGASGACTTGCRNDTDCASGSWCDGGTATTAGVCKARLANGTPVPSSVGGKCSATVGTRVCTSGVCDASDNACGLNNNVPCSAGAACRSNICDNGTCGKVDDKPCALASECKSAVCAAGKCSLKCNNDRECGGPASGLVCNDERACARGCRGITDASSNGCPESEVCSSTSASIGSCTLRVDEVADAGVVPGPKALATGGGIQGGGQNCSVGGPGSSSALALLVVALGAALSRRRASH